MFLVYGVVHGVSSLEVGTTTVFSTISLELDLSLCTFAHPSFEVPLTFQDIETSSIQWRLARASGHEELLHSQVGGTLYSVPMC